MVEGMIILELKSVPALKEVFRHQVINYLRISGLRVRYLVNFRYEKVELIAMIPTRERLPDLRPTGDEVIYMLCSSRI